MSTQDDLFLPVINLPEEVRAERYRRLVGLDDVKARLRTEALLLTDPEQLQTWSRRHYGRPVPALTLFADRAPLFVFAGDVGSGKSALAESFGGDLANTLGKPVRLYRLKLSTRGSGLVGEMTTLIGDAFEHLHAEGKRARNPRGVTSVLILVIDEADALAQSRDGSQMHHEDRAGVDALLAGIDSLATSRVPVLVVLCTNRAAALDPAVLRRAAARFDFPRPDAQQRAEVLRQATAGMGIQAATIADLVERTGPRQDRPGYTYSDLTQRLIPAAVLTAFPDQPVDSAVLLATADALAPTPVFAQDTP